MTKTPSSTSSSWISAKAIPIVLGACLAFAVFAPEPSSTPLSIDSLQHERDLRRNNREQNRKQNQNKKQQGGRDKNPINLIVANENKKHRGQPANALAKDVVPMPYENCMPMGEKKTRRIKNRKEEEGALRGKDRFGRRMENARNQGRQGKLPGCPEESITPNDSPSPSPTASPTTSPTALPSEFPSSLPSTPTISPSPTSPGTVLLIKSQIEYRFFDDVTPRQPTMEEIDEVLVETTRFYTDILGSIYSNLATFEAVFVDSRFGADYGDQFGFPVRIDFDARAEFDGVATVPTPASVFAAMENADYQLYIINYVLNSLPLFTTIFFETQEVAFNARLPSPPTISPTPTTPLSVEPTVDPVPTAAPTARTPAPTTSVSLVVESSIDYRLFGGIVARAPTPPELVDLMDQTSRFYTNLLTSKYSNFDTFVAEFVVAEYDPSDMYPIKMDFDANVYFAEGTAAPDPYDVFLVMKEKADYTDYITDYAWRVEPVGESIFWEVQVVEYSSREFIVAPFTTRPNTQSPTFFDGTSAPRPSFGTIAPSPTLGGTSAPSPSFGAFAPSPSSGVTFAPTHVGATVQ